jgi:hypothetical protein
MPGRQLARTYGIEIVPLDFSLDQPSVDDGFDDLASSWQGGATLRVSVL